MHRRVTDYLVYRWRYIIGYSFIVISIGIMLTVAAFYIPHELRQAEINSALTSASLGTSSMTPQAAVDLPYHLLQKFSFILFGVSTFTIKLPSIVLGALTALGVFLLIRTWFKANVAVLATALVTITSQFLFLAQDGTPGIMFAFLSVWLLFVATFVTRRKYFGVFWKVMTVLAMAASMYTPMGIYLVLVMLTTAIFHPHIRFLIRRFNKVKIGIALTLGAVALLPLGYAIYLQPSLANNLLGVPGGNINFLDNLTKVVTSSIGLAAQSSSHLISPIYPLGAVILMAVGLFRILTHSYTARSYITILWGTLMLLMVILNPTYITNLFPVFVILTSYGIIDMIRSWYKIFPRNPYARVAGMLPLVVLVLAMVTSGVTRFTNAYHYSPEIMAHYSQDLNILEKTLQAQAAHRDNTHLVTSASELPFYSLVAKYNPQFSVGLERADKKAVTIYTKAAKRPNSPPTKIAVNTRAANADRFYIYK